MHEQHSIQSPSSVAERQQQRDCLLATWYSMSLCRLLGCLAARRNIDNVLSNVW